MAEQFLPPLALQQGMALVQVLLHCYIGECSWRGMTFGGAGWRSNAFVGRGCEWRWLAVNGVER